MNSMDVVTSEEDTGGHNKENEEESNDTRQAPIRIIDDSANSPIPFDDLNATEEVREDMQVKLQIGQTNTSSKSLNVLEDKASPTNKGDGAIIDQRTFKSKDAVPSTSRVVVKRRIKEPRAPDISTLRPVLPRKSKEKAKQMLKVIARGIIILPRVTFQQRVHKRRRRVKRPNLNLLRLAKKKMPSSLQTVWVRPRSQRHRSRSADSWRSDYECSRCCQCSNHQFS